MQAFQLTSHVSPEGLLQIQLPADLANQDVEIVLTIQPKIAQNAAKLSESPLFGLWRDRPECEDVQAFVDNLRTGRF
ncbi:hypothetical protein [Beggiatoa leptomitoformis]|uniref:Uncharacterized protein n=1 Tax=Beggiatoa leptomitoformis TaxID=288004 RepID=A0A2N9YJ11_9GAMM|nr:hypothetical protein [Beggiatoa leptomitoformis]ALG67449.1 hypothetical protein AL038_06705 [Beggiatoa leptomitoformis]AUI70335.1 hypothetical protein BLE401_17600 [Beggiatoa leptomitoformis]